MLRCVAGARSNAEERMEHVPFGLPTRHGAELRAAIHAAAQPLAGAEADYDALLDQIGERRIVLLGEATHGTHEFYAARAAITRRLVGERGFTVVAVEADWPDAARVHRFVRGAGRDTTPERTLSDFQRFPTWMWRNSVVRDFVGWLRAHNEALAPGARPAGFYGLDLYSMATSIAAVIAYLEKVDPEAASRARDRYSCFGHAGRDPERYGYLAARGHETCEDDVVAQLVELQQRAAELARRDGAAAAEQHFFAEQNARLVKNAEQYYRAMFRGRDESWNLRDTHMADTLAALLAHLDQGGGPTKAVVWAHNSHLGDARATEMGWQGELNVGQLARERFGDAVFSLGFTTYEGAVTAATNWDEPPQHKRVRPALPESYEALFHESGPPRFLLPLDAPSVAEELRAPRLERAIGVVYRPESERISHYFHARLADQFDAVIHLDVTRAVEPLERVGWRERAAGDDRDRVPETYPFGQ
jgi:erythromycin esterase-like protein